VRCDGIRRLFALIQEPADNDEPPSASPAHGAPPLDLCARNHYAADVHVRIASMQCLLALMEGNDVCLLSPSFHQLSLLCSSAFLSLTPVHRRCFRCGSSKFPLTSSLPLFFFGWNIFSVALLALKCGDRRQCALTSVRDD